MQKFDPVRIVVAGVGEFGRRHARTLAGLAEAHLVGVVDANAESLRRLQEEIRDLAAWATIDRAIQESDAEAYVIATRTDSHIDIAAKVLRAGKPALVEKPLASNVKQGQQLERLVKPDSSNLMVGHVLLFAPLLKEFLREAKERGDVPFFQAVRHRPARLREFFPEETPLSLTMVHDLYIAHALMDGQEPQQFRAWLHPSGDAATAELRWANGTCGSFAATFLTPAGKPSDGFDRFEVFGRHFTARLSLNPQPFELWTDKAEWPVALDIHDDPQSPSGWLAEELRHFCRVVRGRASVPVGARYHDALQVQRWMDTLEQDAKGRRSHAG